MSLSTNKFLVSAFVGILYFALNSPAVYKLTNKLGKFTYDEENECPTIVGNILHNFLVLGLVTLGMVKLSQMTLKVPILAKNELFKKTFYFILIVFLTQIFNIGTRKLWNMTTCPDYQMAMLQSLVYAVIFMMIFMNIPKNIEPVFYTFAHLKRRLFDKND